MVLEAATILLVFVGILFAGSKALPGQEVALTDAEGALRTCKLNGVTLYLITVLAVLFAQISPRFSLSVLHTHFAALFVVANVFAFALSGWLYWRGARAASTSTGFWRGFVLGRDFNPALFGVDLKLFSYRPSLIALALFNLSFLVVQYETYGEITRAMALYQIFTFVYVLNYFQFEYGMIYTWDILSERFGLMLVWGNFVLVPFFYCLGGWWLVHAPDSLSNTTAIYLILLFALGFWLFRGANQQKHRFKQDPKSAIWGRPAESLDGRLLVSGFWGLGRHLNYTGEICVYMAFILTTGFQSWLPYLLPLWLIGLLWHRARRDERRCRAKYGELWTRYTERVRFAMLP